MAGTGWHAITKPFVWSVPLWIMLYLVHFMRKMLEVAELMLQIAVDRFSTLFKVDWALFDTVR